MHNVDTDMVQCKSKTKMPEKYIEKYNGEESSLKRKSYVTVCQRDSLVLRLFFPVGGHENKKDKTKENKSATREEKSASEFSKNKTLKKGIQNMCHILASI